MNGRRVRVEPSSGKSRWGRGGPPTRRGGGRYRDGYRRNNRRSRYVSAVKLREVRLLIAPHVIGIPWNHLQNGHQA